MDTTLDSHDRPGTAPRRRTRLAALLSLCWLLGTAYAFWWFQLRNLQPFDPAAGNRSVLFEAQQLRSSLSELLSGGPAGDKPVATLVHFWEPDCPCNRFNERHVRDIVAQYSQRGVRFLVVAGAAGALSRAELEARARATFGPAVRLATAAPRTVNDLTPSSPATAILDARGQLAYFGPYSSGALCTTGNGAFAERVLDELLLGNNPQQWNTWASGCFCRWERQA